MTSRRLWMLTALTVGLLMLSMLFSAARLNWHMAGHTAIIPVDVDAPPPADSMAPLADINAIVAFAPFGQAISAAPEQQGSERPVQLDLVLRGVLVDPDPTESRAYIRTAGTTSVFRIGETVQLAELVAINADTVTLKLGDRLQIVGFGGLLEGGSASEKVAQDTQPSTDDPFARLAAAIVPGNGSLDLRDGPPPETTDDYINLWRDRITQNPQAAMDSVGVELVANGYRIKADPDIGVTLAGLRAGDVITQLNGQRVGDLSRDRKLYDDVAAAGIARLEVLRDGQSILLTFPLR